EDAVAAVVAIAAGRRPARGQGYLVSAIVRKAIEDYAVQWATEYYEAEGWTVADVGLTHSFDLCCTRGTEELHVEVKGTTSVGESVMLTPNEVRHAAEAHPHIDLFVVAGVTVDASGVDRPVVSGGSAWICSGWTIEDARLTPVGYEYATGIGVGDDRSWK